MCLLLIVASLSAGSACRHPAGEGENVATYRVGLRRGQLLSVAVRQVGADVELLLREPGDRTVLDVDSPNSKTGMEHLDFIAEENGVHVLAVRQNSATRGGRYTVEIAAPRPPTAVDLLRARACRLLSDAKPAERLRNPAGRRQSLPLYRRAALLSRAAGDGMAEAIAEIRLGQADDALDDVAGALAAWERARDVLARHGLAGTLPTLDNLLGKSYERQGEPLSAEAAYAAALTSARRLGDRFEEVAARCYLAMIRSRAGASWEALVSLDEALALAQDAGADDGRAMALTARGRVLMGLGQLDAAGDDLSRAIEIDRSSGVSGEEAAATLERGWLRFLAGDPQRARQELQRAIDLGRDAGDRLATALALSRMGSLARDTGAPAEAVADYQQALAVYRDRHESADEAAALSNLGLAQFLAGDAAAGLRSTGEAVARLQALGNVSSEAYARCRRARCERALDQLPAARADVETGLSKLDAIRTQAESSDLRLSYLDSVHDQYELLIDILMDLHAAHPAAGFDRAALAAAEQGRARGLLDLIVTAQQRGAPPDDAALRRLHTADDRIREAEEATATAAVRSSPNPPASAASGRSGSAAAMPAAMPASSLSSLLAERDAALVALRPRAAAPGGRAQREARVVGTAEIQRELLDAETVLLVYSLGDSRSFVWAVSRDGVEAAVLPRRAVLEDAARNLHDLLVKSGAGGSLALAGEEARRLSATLLGPVAAALPGRRIAVMPDGALAYLPFADLPDPCDLGGDPLVVRHEVVVLPSASVLAAIRQRTAHRPPAPKLLAVLADPAFQEPAAGAAPGGEEAETRSLRALGIGRVEALPGSRREAQAILAMAPPAERLGAMGTSASRLLVIDGALQPFRILHFATHALVHPSVPELSGILLATVDERGHPVAGFLRSFEIAEQNLPADLVVLAACSTGLGEQLKGEGLVGLTQSFFHAGAARVVVSLWDVGDRATAAVMTAFYRELLQAGRTPAAALRAAQLEVRQDPLYGRPFSWAGFELQGDWRPLR